jgi:2-polyprenyl-3-methyl-5-hydroxy-6-metoxy-1,4-benzoquinol methylase
MFEDIHETPYGVRKRIQFIYEEIEKRIRNIENRSKIKILDIGCGTGDYITIPLGSLEASIIGIDTHLPSIEHARRRNSYPNIQFQCVSIDELGNNQFDFIICSEVLEHLHEPEKMLESIGKLLKPCGICIITIPNGYGPKEMEARLYKMLNDLGLFFPVRHFTRKSCKRLEKGAICQDSLNFDSPHIQFFSYKQFKDLVEKAGLLITKRRNRVFLSGFFSIRIFLRSKRMIDWNVKISDNLPCFFNSGWMFVIEHRRVKQDG